MSLNVPNVIKSLRGSTPPHREQWDQSMANSIRKVAISIFATVEQKLEYLVMRVRSYIYDYFITPRVWVMRKVSSPSPQPPITAVIESEAGNVAPSPQRIRSDADE